MLVFQAHLRVVSANPNGKQLREVVTLDVLRIIKKTGCEHVLLRQSAQLPRRKPLPHDEALPLSGRDRPGLRARDKDVLLRIVYLNRVIIEVGHRCVFCLVPRRAFAVLTV